MEPMERSKLILALELTTNGLSCKKAASRLGVPNATLARWLARVAECGGDVDEALTPKANGRPAKFEPNPFETALARWYRLNKESLTVAAYFFARDERVRPELRDVIETIEEKALATGRKEDWPESVRRAFRVTPKEIADFQGKKSGVQEEMITRRGMFEILPDGTVRDILPGECLEMDDYSTNQPFLYRDPQTGEIPLGRQVLACRDLCSPKWLAFDHVGRPKDAYRGEDICRTVERIVRAWGKPKRFRFEKGSWESSFVHGIEVPGMKGRWGDWNDIMTIEHVFKSKGKGGIEGGFNVLQRWLGHTGTDIGRRRGQFEEATRRLRQLQNTNIDPQSLGFLTQEESSILHEAAAALINSRPMAREHLGGERVSPDDLVARLGWHTTPLKEEEEWYFLPYKALRTVRGGHVKTNHKASGWPTMYFAVNGVSEGIYFESGHQVLIAYDPARPELGARVCNADVSARNRHGWKMGQHILTAFDHGLAPQFNAAEILTPHMITRKKASAAAATTFRTIRAAAGMPQPSGSREAVAMNGQGGVVKAGDITKHESTAPAAQLGPVPENIRPSREIMPAISSRAMPVDAAAEIRRLQAALEEA
jgi:hypothetical protein